MKFLKSLMLIAALFVLPACSASGNNGSNGGSQTIFDKLIGTWDGSATGAGPIVFTKQDVIIAIRGCR